jgi:hypothetical protein
MIAEFLESHLNAPFPPGARDLQGTDLDLDLLDANVVGLAESYLKAGQLTPEQRDILEAGVADLRGVASRLPEGMQDYFGRLHALAVAVLKELPVRGPER